MKRLFQIWLVVFISIAFAITVYGTYTIQSNFAKETALNMLKIHVIDAEKRIKHSEENLHKIKELTETSALAKARIFASILEFNPEIVNDFERLEKIRQDLDVDEITVTNGAGIMISSIPKDYIGYNMASKDQSKEFLQLIDKPGGYYIQKPMPNGATNRIFQYVGVTRKDDRGFVQVAYSPKRLEEAMQIADISYIANEFRIGTKGELKIVKKDDKESLDILNKANEIVVNKLIGEDPNNLTLSLCYYKKCGDYILRASLPENEMFLSRDAVINTMTIGYLVLFTLIVILTSFLLQKVVIKGIYSVNASLNKITEGDLNEEVKVHNTVEFDVLSKGINSTVGALKKAIEAESKRIDAELEIGRTIQNSVLPDNFPNNELISVYASMNTAKEVGGDFYDFFYIDETHQTMLIADVSGKGITAALFMMNAKALIKELLLSGKTPAEAIDEANKSLCENNKARMFLTMFLAILDTETGKVSCINAGHNPPLLKHKGNWEYQKIKHSMALGVSNKVKFTEVTLELEHGDCLFMYTDGVTEAQNIEHKLYGEARLKEFLSSQGNDPKTVLQNVLSELRIFAGEAPQSDDITMIMGLYK